jgi:formylglycine-generating enzyme required for sulfatase activity
MENVGYELYTKLERRDFMKLKMVTLPNGLIIGKYPVTNLEYELFDPKHERCYSSKEDDQPVVNVNWNEAHFCAEFFSCRLPTEEEWEYACRAGTETKYNTGEKLTTKQANFDQKIGKTTPVGRYPSNKWGLYDMHGNVWEWCSDKWTDESRFRILRGGSWGSVDVFCRSDIQEGNDPDFRCYFIGFRLVFVP